jgi:hypothetical protein
MQPSGLSRLDCSQESSAMRWSQAVSLTRRNSYSRCITLFLIFVASLSMSRSADAGAREDWLREVLKLRASIEVGATLSDLRTHYEEIRSALEVYEITDATTATSATKLGNGLVDLIRDTITVWQAREAYASNPNIRFQNAVPIIWIDEVELASSEMKILRGTVLPIVEARIPDQLRPRAEGGIVEEFRDIAPLECVMNCEDSALNVDVVIRALLSRIESQIARVAESAKT